MAFWPSDHYLQRAARSHMDMGVRALNNFHLSSVGILFCK